jgi:outer membrane protein TolC
MNRTALLFAVVVCLIVPTTRAHSQSITLDEAVIRALETLPSMVQARGAIENAHATKLQTWGSWLPSVSASAGNSVSSTNRWDERTQTFVSADAKSSYSAGISANMTVFDGFARLADHRIANADLVAADASFVNSRYQTILQVKQAFFNALAAEELVRISDTRIERAQEQLNISIEKLNAGTATRSDTLRSHVEVANAELQRLQAETQLAAAEADLARMVGMDGAVSAASSEDLLVITDIDTTALRAEVFAHSPQIQESDAAERSAEAQFSATTAQYLPRATASYSRSWSASEWLDFNPSWSARLSFSWTLFNGFTREMNRTRSAMTLESARAQAEDIRRQVNTQLTQYLASLAAAQTSLEIAEASRAASEEDLRVQRERYRLGAATIVDVLASQVNLDQAEVDIVQARFDYLVAKAQIEALVGREL